MTEHTRRKLGRPALHGLLGGLFAGAFTWPFLVWESPLKTWVFLFATWLVCVAVAFVVSLGDHGETDDWEELEKDVGDV